MTSNCALTTTVARETAPMVSMRGTCEVAGAGEEIEAEVGVVEVTGVVEATEVANMEALEAAAEETGVTTVTEEAGEITTPWTEDTEEAIGEVTKITGAVTEVMRGVTEEVIMTGKETMFPRTETQGRGSKRSEGGPRRRPRRPILPLLGARRLELQGIESLSLRRQLLPKVVTPPRRLLSLRDSHSLEVKVKRAALRVLLLAPPLPVW